MHLDRVEQDPGDWWQNKQEVHLIYQLEWIQEDLQRAHSVGREEWAVRRPDESSENTMGQVLKYSPVVQGPELVKLGERQHQLPSFRCLVDFGRTMHQLPERIELQWFVA